MMTPSNRTPLSPDRLLRLREVLAIVGLSKSTVYVMMRRALFPQSVQAHERCARWRESEVLAWVATRQNR